MCKQSKYQYLNVNDSPRFNFSHSDKMVDVSIFCGVLSILIADTFALTVSSPGTVFGLLGKFSTELVCTYTVDAGDTGIYIEWQRKVFGSSSYQAIALFSPSLVASVSNSEEGHAVNGRVNLTIRTAGSPTAKVLFTEIKCLDEREYKCVVSYRTTAAQTSKESITNLVVRAKPTTPNPVVVEPNTSSVEENASLKFTCSGNVGKPAGKYKWTKYRGNTAFPITPSTTTPTSIPNDCTFTGVSVITLSMAREDNGAIIRCTVDTHDALSSSESESLYQQTDKFTVYYQVRTPTVMKVPSQAVYYAGQNTLILTCVIDGNPLPTYKWLSPTNIELSTTSILMFSPMYANQSGEYTCIAENSYNSKRFKATSKVEIRIDPPTTAPSTSRKYTDLPTTASSTSVKYTDCEECDKTGWIAAFVVAVVINVAMDFAVVKVIHRSRTNALPSGAKLALRKETITSGGEYEIPMDSVPTIDTYEQLQHKTRGPESHYTALQSGTKIK